MTSTRPSLGILLASLWLVSALSCGDGSGSATSSSASSMGAGGPGGSSTGGAGGAGGSGGTGIAGAGGEGGQGGAAPPCVPRREPLPLLMTPPSTLSATGLYDDIAGGVISSRVAAFEPAYALWSDGAEKLRFVYLPECEPIDSGDMDHWSLPVGTRLWKQFTVGGTRIETRLIHRFGPGDDDFFYAAYLWNDALTEADLVLGGVIDAKGTDHDVPSESACDSCHGHLVERALGFSAVQLSHSGPGVTLDSLLADNRFTVDPPAGGYPVPGDAVARAALGYLHANCGNCHNATGVEFNTTPFDLRLKVAETTVETTSTYVTSVGVPVEKFVQPGVTHRIAVGDEDASCVYWRMNIRQVTKQMPPLGTEILDPDGLATVQAWIQAL